MARLPKPPRCPAIPKEIVEHGVVRQDPYFWLREKDNPEVEKYVQAENAYYSSVMCTLSDLKEKYFEKLKSRLEPEEIEVPYRLGSYHYGSRTPEGLEYPIYFRQPSSREGIVGGEETVLDLNEIAKMHDYVDLDAYEVNDAQTVLAYSLDIHGDEIHRIFFRGLGTYSDAPTETIDQVEGNVVFSSDGLYLYYVRLNEQHRPFQVWRHALHCASTTDVLLYEESDGRFFLSLQRSSDGNWIFVNAASAESTEVLFAPRAERIDSFRIVSPRAPRHEYSVDAQGSRFLILSNHEEPNFVLYETPVTCETVLPPSDWRAIFRGDAKIDLRDLAVFENHFALLYANSGVIGVRVYSGRSVTGMPTRELDFPEEIRHVSFHCNLEYHADRVRVLYSSPITPPQTLEFDLNTGLKAILHERVVPGFRKEDYVVERIEVTSPDGTQVPVSLMFREADRGKALPTLLYGYGSYGMVTPTGFSSLRATIVDAGFLYAIAHVRGSGDLGQRWYREGKFLKKKNTFLDFQAAAVGLVEKGRAIPGEITIHGGSAGGLLVGATMNLNPKLYRGVIAEVPFVDILNTMFDETLPLTPTEWDEWGDPRKREFFEAMREYSPYDRLVPGEYPYIFVNGGWNDPRVTYWEPTKWVARLREIRKDNRLTVLDIEMGAGHFGVTGRFAALEKPAELLAFLHAIHFERERFD